MKYKCGQCGETAVVIADEDMDNPGTSPPTTVWVVCDDCGYAVPKDTADKKELLAACEDSLAQLAKLLEWAELQIESTWDEEREAIHTLQTAIALAKL